MDQHQKGKQAEALAQAYLQALGYVPLAQNFRAGHKEIDLVMRDGDVIVFVEVKARSNNAYGYGREYVTPRKQKHLIMAAYAYLAQLPADTPARFDVVEIDLRDHSITHIPNAFTT